MFRDAKVGDRVWDFLYGYGKVVEVNKDELWVEFKSLYLDKKRVYTFDGILGGVGYPQTLFWDKIKFDMPFSLENELKKLEIIEFRTDEENYYLYWDNCCELIGYDYACQDELIGYKYFSISSINTFIENIIGKKITKEQFFEAYENVFGGRND